MSQQRTRHVSEAAKRFKQISCLLEKAKSKREPSAAKVLFIFRKIWLTSPLGISHNTIVYCECMGRRWLQPFGVWTCEIFELSKDHWHEPKWQRNENLDVTWSFWTHREISTHARMRTLVKLCTQARLVFPLTQDSCNSASLNSLTLGSFSACHQEAWE